SGVNFTGLPWGSTFYYDPASDSIFSGFNDQDRPGVPAAQAAGLVDGYVIKELASGNLGMNNVDSYLIYPMDRFNMFTQGNYKINDYIGVFGAAYFSKVHAETVQEPGIITTGWGVQVDPNTHRESIPGAILEITDSRPNPDAPIDIFALLPFNRVGLTDTFTFNMTAGLEGEIPSIGWTWEAFVSHGEAETTSQMKGFLSLERVRTIMELPEFGRGAVIKGNQYPGSPGFGTVEATCASGLNPFDWASVTQDCWTAVKAEVKSKMLMEQNIYEANSQGRIMDLPAGEMRGALGLSYRENNYYFLSDTVNSAGTSFNDQILGLYPSADSYGSIEAKEGYAELLVPLLKDLPFMKQVDLSLGGRRSDYDTTGVSYTYKAMLDWKTLDFLRLRGGYSRAERAPNIAELYLAPENAFGFSGYGDVCSLKNGAVNSANPTNNPENWMNVVSVCGQMMEAVNPDGAQDNRYYGLDYDDIVAYGNANAITISPNATAEEKTAYLDTYRTAMGISDQDWSEIPDAGGSYLWPVTYGNPDLDPEKADTWTIGFVLDSFIDDIPALMDWRVSVDYYSIKVKDAIGEQTGDIVMRQCVDPQFNPTFDPNSPYCAGIIRNPDGGGLQTLYRTFYNNGRFQTSGIDLQVNWGMDAGPGHVTVTSLFNYLIDMKSAELVTDPLKEYAGTFGPSENGLNGNSVEYRALTTVGYSWKDIEASIRWQYTSRVKQVSGTTTGFPSYNMFDLTGSYQLMDNVRIRFGCENIFNKKPPLYGVDYSKLNEGENGMTGGSFSYYLSDVNGRRFYVGAKVFF
ncbi:MAG: TonB-dependent receptor, partial [Deltaproteobacteria bacterium]|nr:TonB-dependent receptor [Deltaproteobacteria bacterium]